ncbi:GGDEF domain-containing response regulator [Leptospira meyeri]|uniref:EAL domain-containing response regulator n=1 Tax=Leptospira meyeri TaxID=29508 RepID=UPI001082DB4F|nr:EAL domain-containing protein [Leptospira meyeri]MCW7490252.1 EAL domain-containing response regulator [Leptospira meyeri]TGM62232.1 GGDEF domain-containing response regulator [Leptospira meyeri]TGM71462.1 GGDEF domain-containing response regulator [Leptospira meyeri]
MNEKPYILCIDDEFFILWNLKEQLKKVFGSNFTIETAESAETAKEIMKEIEGSSADLAVVICDHVMPGQKGDEFLIEMQETHPRTKKIMLTGQAPAQAIGNALNHGCLYRYLSKPWDAHDLELTIKQAIDAYFQEKSLEEKNKELADTLYFHRDSKYPNFESLVQQLKTDRSPTNEHSMILIKIVSFPTIIKTFGIEVYRKLFRKLLQLLSVHLQNEEQVFHIYSDEIAVLSNLSEQALVEKIRSFRLLLKSDDLILDGVGFHLDCRYSSASGREDCYYKAKLALFRAETQSSSDFVSYTEDLSTDHHLQNFQRSQKIQTAITNKQIIPYFQGIIDNHTKQIRKFECLARIKDRDAILTPDVFLKLAKVTGSIRMIGLQMIDESMNYFSDKPFDFSINLTESELEYKSFSKWVEARLSHYRIDPNRVTFEILEDVSFSENRNSLSTIRDLKTIGCQIAIDDFGVQYSNLARLLEFDPDYLKIDGQFIRNLPENKTAYLLVQGIVELARGIGAKVVAEFVDRPAIQDMIETLGIEYSQGYLFMKPSPTIPTEANLQL